MIKLLAIGNLGKDCLVNQVNGKNVINFNVAHTEKYRDQAGNQKDKTIWIDCAYWTERLGIADYLKKGQQVYVEGSPDIRTYQTQDGRTGASMVLRVNSVQLVGGSRNATDGSSSMPSGNVSQSQEPPMQQSPEIPEQMDDLPF